MFNEADQNINGMSQTPLRMRTSIDLIEIPIT
jgi:hypothetical protein